MSQIKMGDDYYLGLTISVLYLYEFDSSLALGKITKESHFTKQ